MNRQLIIKILSLTTSVITIGLSLASNRLEDMKMDALVEEKVRLAIEALKAGES